MERGNLEWLEFCNKAMCYDWFSLSSTAIPPFFPAQENITRWGLLYAWLRSSALGQSHSEPYALVIGHLLCLRLSINPAS
jgi:hypothetical protein